MDAQTTTRFFDGIATTWDQIRSGLYTDRLRDKIWDAARIAPGDRVLDIGTGTGFLALEFARRGAHVVAADASARMLEELRSRREPGAKIEMLLVEGDRIDVPDASVDAVVASMYLHHVEDPAAAIRELVRTLRPGGRLVLADLSTHDHEALRVEHHDRWMGFDAGRLLGWLQEAGLVGATVCCGAEDCCSTTSQGRCIRVPILIAQGRKTVTALACDC